MQTIDGPTLPGDAPTIFQVTLPNGAVLTRPSDFEPLGLSAGLVQPRIVVSEAGIPLQVQPV